MGLGLHKNLQITGALQVNAGRFGAFNMHLTIQERILTYPACVPVKLEVLKCKQSRKLITTRINRLAEVNRSSKTCKIHVLLKRLTIIKREFV